MKTGDLIRKYRKAKGMTQKELEKDVTALTAFFQNGNGFAL